MVALGANMLAPGMLKDEGFPGEALRVIPPDHNNSKHPVSVGGLQEKGEETKALTTEDMEGVDDKAFAEAKKIDKAKLHRTMDKEFEKVADKLVELSKGKVLDEYWKTVSRAIEDSWLEHLEVDKETAKKMKGRGEVKITKVVPKAPTQKATTFYQEPQKATTNPKSQ